MGDSADRMDAGQVAAQRPAYRILFIDDSSLVRQAAVVLLEAYGHRVSTAEDGPAGLEELRRNEYDVVFVDYRMPRMTGREVAYATKIIRPNAYIVLLTGLAIEQLGADGVPPEDFTAEKPLKAATLELILNRVQPR